MHCATLQLVGDGFPVPYLQARHTGGLSIPFAIGDVRLAVKRLRCPSIAAHTAPSLASATGGGRARGRRQALHTYSR